MISDKDSVQLSDYCFSVCEALKTTTQEEDIRDLNESAMTALEDLERWVVWVISPFLVVMKQRPQGYPRYRADTQESGEHTTC